MQLLKPNSLLLLTSLVFFSCVKSPEIIPENSTQPITKQTIIGAQLPVNVNGDSLTEGAGADTYTFPQYIQAALSDQKVNNNGFGGQRAEQLAARQGGLPVYITVKGDKFNGSASVLVTDLVSIVDSKEISNPFLSTPSGFTASINGTVGDVKCVLTTTTNNSVSAKQETYTLTPLESSSAAIPPKTLFVPNDGKQQENCFGIYWYGRNNVGSPLASDGTIAGVNEILVKCVNFNKSGYYIVVGVLNGYTEAKGTGLYAQVIATNVVLAKTFGNHFVASTPPTAGEMRAISYTPSDRDLRDIERGVFPAGMRADDYHLNSAGYHIMAARVIALIKAYQTLPGVM